MTTRRYVIASAESGLMFVRAELKICFESPAGLTFSFSYGANNKSGNCLTTRGDTLGQSVSNSTEPTSKSPDNEDSEDIFSGGECGEPLITQRVTLDFTPNDLDNDFVQRKCCAFWDYINSRPELKNLKAVPDREVYSNESESSVVQTQLPPQKQSLSHNISKTAVDMLEFVEEKGLIDRAFEARLPKSYCENNRIPSSNESITGTSKGPQLDNNKGLKNKKEKRQSNTKALPKLRLMCNKMQEWDMNHPKSMKPPGPPPALPEDIQLIRH